MKWTSDFPKIQNEKFPPPPPKKKKSTLIYGYVTFNEMNDRTLIWEKSNINLTWIINGVKRQLLSKKLFYKKEKIVILESLKSHNIQLWD